MNVTVWMTFPGLLSPGLPVRSGAPLPCSPSFWVPLLQPQGLSLRPCVLREALGHLFQALLLSSLSHSNRQH